MTTPLPTCITLLLSCVCIRYHNIQTVCRTRSSTSFTAVLERISRTFIMTHADKCRRDWERVCMVFFSLFARIRVHVSFSTSPCRRVRYNERLIDSSLFVHACQQAKHCLADMNYFE